MLAARKCLAPWADPQWSRRTWSSGAGPLRLAVADVLAVLLAQPLVGQCGAASWHGRWHRKRRHANDGCAPAQMLQRGVSSAFRAPAPRPAPVPEGLPPRHAIADA